MEFVMSKWAIALTLATVVCGSASAYLWQELREEREHTAALQTQVAELQRTVSAATHTVSPVPIAPPRDEPTLPPPSVQNAPPKPSASPATTPGLAPPSPIFTANAVGMGGRMDPEMRRRIQESHEQQARLLKDPDYRELVRSQQKLSMQQMYGDLEPLLELSKEESERLLDVLAEQTVRVMEQQRPWLPPIDGQPPDQNAVLEQQRRFQEQRRTTEAEIAAALGPKYNQWQEYQNNGWARSQVMQLRQSLSSTDEPIRLDQVKPLVEAIAREQKQTNPPLRTQLGWSPVMDAQSQVRLAEESLERSVQSQQRVRSAVSGLLTPTQLEQLQRQHDQNLKMQELNLKQQRARAEAQARGELPPDTAMGSVNMVTSYSE
jgi:hypothetical protein